MVSRLLHICGLYLGPKEKIIPPRPDNPAGFWENMDFVKLNDQILARLGGGWDFFPILSDDKWNYEKLLDPLKNKVLELTEGFAGRGLWGWKDPRTSLTIPFWKGLFPELKAVVCLRNPLEVAFSLQKRNNSSIPFGVNLWLTYNKHLIANTKSEERVVTHYDSYFLNPHQELSRILKALGVQVSPETIVRACATISRELRHNQYALEDLTRIHMPKQVLEIYETLCTEAGFSLKKGPKSNVRCVATAAPSDALVSIIILAHNQTDYTKKCIESILKCTEEPFELILVDNGSTDGSARFFEKLRSAHRANSTGKNAQASMKKKKNKKARGKSPKSPNESNSACKGITVVRNDVNLGFAAGNNQGMALASGDFILLLNNDVVVTPGWLSRLIAVAKARPEIGIVGPKSNYVSGAQLVRKVGYNPKTLSGLHPFATDFAIMYRGQAEPIGRVVGFCMLIKRAVIDRIGGMDTIYGLGNFEDDDFSLRAALAGFESWIAKDCFIHHFGSRTFVGARMDYRRSLLEKWEIFKEKWGIPQELPYGAYYDFSSIANEGFVPAKHFIPLTASDSLNIEVAASLLPLSTDQFDNAVEPQLKELDKNITATIVIPLREQDKDLKQCLDAVDRYTPEPHEVILVGKAESNKLLRRLLQIEAGNRRYRSVTVESEAYFSKLCNVGMQASAGEHIVILDVRVLVTPSWLTRMLEFSSKHLDRGIVGPVTNSTDGVLNAPKSDNITSETLEDFARSFTERNRFRRAPARALTPFCMLFKRDLAKKIGLFDEELRSSHFSVDDFCLRAELAGYRNYIVGDVCVYRDGNAPTVMQKKSFNEKWTTLDPSSPSERDLVTLDLIQKAEYLDQRNQTEAAIDTLLKAIRHNPKDPRPYYRLAESLIDKKRFKDALEALNELPSAEQTERKLELTGYGKEGVALFEEAEDCAERLLSMDPGYAPALNLKGVLSYRKGDRDGAEGYLRKAIQADPGYGEPYTNLGVLKWSLDHKQAALDLFEKGFVLSPTVHDIFTLYHSAVTELEDFGRAEIAFREACALHPQHKKLKYLLIDVLIQQSKLDDAMKQTEEAIASFGIDDGILSAALRLREKIGPLEIEKPPREKAKVSLCMIVRDEEHHLPRCLHSAKPLVDEIIVVDTGSKDQTREIVTAFGAKVYDLTWNNDFSEARNLSLSKAQGDWILLLDADESISLFDQAKAATLFKLKPRGLCAYSFITRNYVDLANITGWTPNDGSYAEEEEGTGWYPNEKVRVFSNDRRIKFENPVHELVEPSLKRLGIKVKKCDVPIHHYGKLDLNEVRSKGERYYTIGKEKLHEKQDDLQALSELAVQAGELGKYAEAAELWQQFIELSPGNPKAFQNLAFAYIQLERYADALDASKKAVELDPNLKEAVLNYSCSELLIGDSNKAIHELERLLHKTPEYPPAIALLAAARCIQGMKKEALSHLDKLKKAGLNCTEFLYDLAKRLLATNHFNPAKSLLQFAVETNNHSRDILALFSECQKMANLSGPLTPEVLDHRTPRAV